MKSLYKYINITFLKFSMVTVVSISCVHAGDHNYGPYPQVYIQECGSCHTPYPAKGLNQEGWNIQLSNLKDHYGTDASIDVNSLSSIRAYLMSNSSKKDKYAPKESTARITKTTWFLKEHGASIPTVGTFSNCNGCHTLADQGNFSEASLKLTKGYKK